MDLNKVIAGLASSGFLGGMAGGAASSALLSKKGRKHAGTALKIGGLAALGGVAWKAYQNYQGQQSQDTQLQQSASAAKSLGQWQGLQETDFSVDDGNTEPSSRAMLLVNAMIAAANADGHLDTDERGRIMERVQTLELARDEKAMVFDALASPPSLAELCAQVTCPESAVEVYLASRLAIDANTPDAQLYLEALSHRLNIPEGLTLQLNEQVQTV